MVMTDKDAWPMATQDGDREQRWCGTERRRCGRAWRWMDAGSSSAEARRLGAADGDSIWIGVWR
jgi:hypothetical protein